MGVQGSVDPKVTFGHYLADLRVQRGRELGELARATRIPESLLQALEYGDVERLPDRVFLANFLRAYAGELGLPHDELEARFDAAYGRPQEPDPAALERERLRRARWQAGVLAVLALAGLAIFIWMNRPVPR